MTSQRSPPDSQSERSSTSEKGFPNTPNPTNPAEFPFHSERYPAGDVVVRAESATPLSPTSARGPVDPAGERIAAQWFADGLRRADKPCGPPSGIPLAEVLRDAALAADSASVDLCFLADLCGSPCATSAVALRARLPSCASEVSVVTRRPCCTMRPGCRSVIPVQLPTNALRA
eukprot:scaffold1154_cov310-Pinguiococcus_pyrenoidosus.AAC.20